MAASRRTNPRDWTEVERLVGLFNIFLFKFALCVFHHEQNDDTLPSLSTLIF